MSYRVLFMFLILVSGLLFPVSVLAQTPTPVPTPPPAYTPTYCDSDFETCYGDGLGKFLLLFLGLFAIFVVGARQRVLLGMAIIFFALLVMPIDVFAFWFFLGTVLLLLADMLLAPSSS